MTRKRAKKLLMAMGFTRDSAESAFVNRDMAGDPAELKRVTRKYFMQARS